MTKKAYDFTYISQKEGRIRLTNKTKGGINYG